MSIPKTPDKLLKSMGLRLEKSRKKKYGNGRGSLSKCAEDLGVSPQSWNDYEAGRRELGFGKVLFFADFFGVNPMWLLAGTNRDSQNVPIDSVDPEGLSAKELLNRKSDLLKQVAEIDSVIAKKIDSR